jgi:hypothetical protein
MKKNFILSSRYLLKLKLTIAALYAFMGVNCAICNYQL